MSDSIRVSRRVRKENDPKMIGLWKIGRTIGKGSSGRVRVARHSKTGQYAAVKIVSKSVLNSRLSLKHMDEEARRIMHGIEREIVIMKLIEHPNIMRLYDVWETSTELYLILEYVEGGELFDYLCDKGRLSTSEALGHFQQIITAVNYCHRFNIAHRDLKPENLLLDRAGNIKVADFGMAAWQGKSDLLQTACGSPHYAAPEVIMGTAYNGACSDVWSCGVILYALLAGGLPFDDEDLGTLLEKVKVGKYTMPTELDSRAKDLIKRMLEKDVTKRITIEEILQHPFYTSQPPKVMPYEAPSLDDIARPLPSDAEVDADILANLRTLWPGVPDEQLKGNLTNDKQTWEKGVYHLLARYRAKRLEDYDEDEEKLAEQRRVKRAKKKNQRVRIAEDIPPRTGPPTPSRARRPDPDLTPVNVRQLTTTGSELFTPEMTSSILVEPSEIGSPVTPTANGLEVRDEKIQNFFQQIVEHLNVMQTNGANKRNAGSAAPSPAATAPPPPTPLTVELGTPFHVRTGGGDYVASDTFADMARGGKGTRPLSIRRRADKENAHLAADWPERKSSMRSSSTGGSSRGEKRVAIVEPAGARGRASRLRKKESTRSSRSESSAASSDGGSFFVSTPKRSWFGGFLRLGPAAYQLLSTQDAQATRAECRRILEEMGVTATLVQAEGMGILKCRLEETRDPAGVMATVKPVKFRVEMRIPTTVQAVSGYTVALNVVMEKGAHSSFKLVYGRLRRDWELDVAPSGYMMECRAEDDDRFVEVVYAS
ncbi:Pkinase-domain-containing protein [Phanerochaete sordida]|uniref:non-specific serine/threonine protein kinase n=1 Tax=Phanerochaete sordida TaxID=48140 RepID=A0A9P3LD78_9APHY|nr:Pkinase-domain-containing protein [Phanerochaete sordida]